MQEGVEWSHRVSTPLPSCSRSATSPAADAGEWRSAGTGSGSAHGRARAVEVRPHRTPLHRGSVRGVARGAGGAARRDGRRHHRHPAPLPGGALMAGLGARAGGRPRPPRCGSHATRGEGRPRRPPPPQRRAPRTRGGGGARGRAFCRHSGGGLGGFGWRLILPIAALVLGALACALAPARAERAAVAAEVVHRRPVPPPPARRHAPTGARPPPPPAPCPQ